MKILWLTNIPSPYRVAFFNELGKLCDLTVLFEKATSAERDQSWKMFNSDYFKPVIMGGKSVGVAEAICPEVIKYLKKNQYDQIVVTNFSDPTGMLAIAWMRLLGIPYAVESDGGFAGSGKGLKEKVKYWLLSKATRYFSTARAHDQYYFTYGAAKERIVRYPFTSLHESDVLDEPVDLQTKQKLREKLGICEEKVLLAVGQFIPRKGFDILLKACAELDSNVGCYIVGGTPTEEYIQLAKELKLTNVHFVGFKLKDELSEYYLAADVFVHPTREDIWGLVVNEAMAKGLPVITTNRCVAGLQLIQDDQEGLIIPVDDVESLQKAIKKAITKQDEISQSALDKIHSYTVENMARVHMEAFDK